MAATADITIVDFNLQEALEGTPVTLESTNGVITDMNTQTGILQKDHAMYRVVIDGVLYQLNKEGVVARGTSAGTQANLVKASMITTYGGRQGQTRGATTGYHDLGYVAALEPRDHFAITALSIMMDKMEGLERANDSTILLYCRAAYRWAQGMMIVAADMREQVEDDPSTEVDVDPEALTENIEKVLYNIHAVLKDGIKVDGLNHVTDSYDIPDVGEDIDIKVSIFKSKYLRFEIIDEMAYSDISVYTELSVTEDNNVSSTRKAGFVIPKGSVVVLMPLDEDVVTISSISSLAIRGKGGNDPNTYVISQV